MTDEVKRDWTVMVYMAGDNSLAEECVFNLTEMKRVGSTDNVAVLAQLQATVSPATRYYITKAPRFDHEDGNYDKGESRPGKAEPDKGLASKWGRHECLVDDCVFNSRWPEKGKPGAPSEVTGTDEKSKEHD